MAQLLVIEDNRTLRELMVLALSMEGFTVHSAADIDTALAILASEAIDLTLTDLIGWPGGGSLEAVRRLHEAAPALPLILVTGYPLPRQISPGDYGISAVLLKPYVVEDLVAVIRQQLATFDRWLDRPA